MKRLLARIEEVLQGRVSEHGPAGVLRLVSMTVLFGGLYGGVMGTFGGLEGDRGWQILISASKVPLLLLATFAISLPSFFTLNTLLAVRGDFPIVVRALASSQAGLTIVLASLAPYTLFWYASFTGYQVAILFNGLMFGVATFAAQGLLRRWYRPLIARHRQHRILLIAWLVLYSFVGIQMAWVLRPFVGMPEAPVQFFRDEAWGNAYVTVAQMIWNAVRR
jgi:hypothetical protein